jgi:hypothetical protein
MNKCFGPASKQSGATLPHSMKTLLYLIAAAGVLGVATPSSATPPPFFNQSRITSYLTNGTPVYAVYQIVGYDAMGYPIYQWVTQSASYVRPYPNYGNRGYNYGYRNYGYGNYGHHNYGYQSSGYRPSYVQPRSVHPSFGGHVGSFGHGGGSVFHGGGHESHGGGHVSHGGGHVSHGGGGHASHGGGGHGHH